MTFHAGEIAVQERAGLSGQAAIAATIIRGFIQPGFAGMLGAQPLAMLGTADGRGRMWASAVGGAPGFLRVLDEHTLRIGGFPIPGDPLAENLGRRSRAGVLVVDLKFRRRLRLNGWAELSPGGIVLSVAQVYFNCQKRVLARSAIPHPAPVAPSAAVRLDRLAEPHQRWIAGADTFFIASSHPESGADLSHRGGRPGFVHVLGASALIFPDYPGNSMFNTLGNLLVDPRAGLLFIDFETSSTLQLTGRAEVVWDQAASRLIDFAERAVRFEVDEVVEIGSGLPLKFGPAQASGHGV